MKATDRIYLDPAISHITDSRVTMLINGYITMRQFVGMLRSPDWLVLDGNIVRLLPRYQYTTLVHMHSASDIPQHLVLQVMQGAHDDAFPPQVLTQLNSIRDKSKACSSCALKRYKNTIRQFITMYMAQYVDTINAHAALQYPAYDGMLPAVFTQQTHPIKYSLKRTPCYDCIQKHIGQAYITALQAVMGYPQHMMLCYGHLAQAIQECPDEARDLKASLTFCLGKSQGDGQLFLPITALHNLIQLHRIQAQPDDIALTPNKQEQSMPLSLLDCRAQKLADMSDILFQQLQTAIQSAARYARACGSQPDQPATRVLWQGQVARIAQLIAPYDAESANAVRNIRLMFTAAPQLSLQQDLGLYTLMERLRYARLQPNPAKPDQLSTEQNTAQPVCESTS